MKATRVGFYFSIIGIPTYFEADFYMNGGGGCSKVQHHRWQLPGAADPARGSCPASSAVPSTTEAFTNGTAPTGRSRCGFPGRAP